MIDPTATEEQLDKLLNVLHKLKKLAEEVGFTVDVDELIEEVKAELVRKMGKWIL